MNTRPPERWPNGTGEWKRPGTTTTMVAGDLTARALLERLPPNTVFVVTLLDMIVRLEDEQQPVSTLVLAGALADDAELVRVLGEIYPAVEVIDHRTLPQ
jgi:hypothetical protein